MEGLAWPQKSHLLTLEGSAYRTTVCPQRLQYTVRAARNPTLEFSFTSQPMGSTPWGYRVWWIQAAEVTWWTTCYLHAKVSPGPLWALACEWHHHHTRGPAFSWAITKTAEQLCSSKPVYAVQSAIGSERQSVIWRGVERWGLEPLMWLWHFCLVKLLEFRAPPIYCLLSRNQFLSFPSLMLFT